MMIEQQFKELEEEKANEVFPEPPKVEMLERQQLVIHNSEVMCPFLKFLNACEDHEHVQFQMKINNDSIDFAKSLGLRKSVNEKIMPDFEMPINLSNS